MAIAGPTTQPGAQQDPALTYKDPNAYIAYLRTRGIPLQQVYQLVIDRFGMPKTPDDQAKDRAAAAQTAGLAQAGGAVGGTLLAAETVRGFPNVKDAFNYLTTSSKPTTTPITESPTTSLPVTPTTQSVAQTALTGNNVIPQGSTVPQGYTSVGTSVDGGTIVAPTKYVNSLPTDDPGFLSTVNWNSVATGGLSALAAYQAYKSYKAGDKVGAGISGATAGAGAASLAGSQTAAAAMPYLGIVAGGYQGYKTAEMLGNSAAGSQRTQQGALGGASAGALVGGSIGSIVPGLGTAIGAGIGALVGGTAGAIGSWTGSSKGKAQFMRDNIRGVLKEGNILNDKYQGTLADGTLYDFGKDGSTLKWKEIDKVSAANPNAWNSTVPLTDALSAGYGFVGQKASDISAWYAKGAVSNAGDDANVAKANARHFAAQQGITYDSIKSKLDEAIKDNRINQTQYNYYLGGAQDLTSGSTQAQGVRPPTPAKGQTVRVSPGMYMNDKGVITPATSKRAALEKYYTSSKTESSKKGK